MEGRQKMTIAGNVMEGLRETQVAEKGGMATK
jgi:hypothetical protein